MKVLPDSLKTTARFLTSILFRALWPCILPRCSMIAWNVVWWIGGSLRSRPRSALKLLWICVSIPHQLNPRRQRRRTAILGISDSFGVWKGEDRIW